jgi:hypothetical protein
MGREFALNHGISHIKEASLGVIFIVSFTKKSFSWLILNSFQASTFLRGSPEEAELAGEEAAAQDEAQREEEEEVASLNRPLLSRTLVKRPMLPVSKFSNLPNNIDLAGLMAGKAKRPMLPMSKFSGLPDTISLDMKSKRPMLPVSKFSGLPQNINLDMRGKRPMLPVSKFSGLPQNINLDMDMRGKRPMLPVSKFSGLPQSINLDMRGEETYVAREQVF